MIESFRSQDMRAEQKLGEFMDSYFYSKLQSKDGSPLSFSRKSDKDSQLKGIDICIEIGGKSMLIDEKASVYYSNVMIPTFAFEIDSMQKGHTEPVEGWFVNDDLQTEYYMLIWPNVKCVQNGDKWVRKDIKFLKKDDFTIVEAMLIDKTEMRNMLEQNGFDKERLLEYARRLRKIHSNEQSKKEEQLFENVKIIFSGQLAEKPINLVIRKEMLQKMAKGIYLISADGFAKIKG